MDDLTQDVNNLFRLLGDSSTLDTKNNQNSIISDSSLENLKDEYRQYIYFGAPGTGKSYQLKYDSLIFSDENIKRTIFHSNTTYSNFVGSFRPFPIKIKDSDNILIDSITYRYVPGVLMKQLTNALLNPDKGYLLIIEELNRANAPAAFGDMFQLLDRDINHQSEYPIDISEDIQYYFDNIVYSEAESEEAVLSMKNKIKNGLIFPNNLFIWATMNSSDQGVMPMDTAFKRRWEQKYFGINCNYDESSFNSFCKINIKYDKINAKISWNDIRMFLNNKLSSDLRVSEDKLMGPYFLSHYTLMSSDDMLTESFKNKVLMYLFDDAAKQRRSDLFNISNNRMMYSEILNEFNENGISIFKDYDQLVDKLEFNS